MEIEFVCLSQWVLAHSDAHDGRGGPFRGHPSKRKRDNMEHNKNHDEAGGERHTTFSSHEKSWRGMVSTLLTGRKKLRKIVDDSSRLSMRKRGRGCSKASANARRKVHVPAATMQKAPMGEKSRQLSTISARRAFLLPSHLVVSEGCSWLQKDRHLTLPTSCSHRSSVQRQNLLRQAQRPTLQ
uniref:Uncharacterized protein n=1 Tax=Rhipicephalus pulchellus TaxID=72859 RepID=L7LZ20_RHIPC